jgi:hypothetical protein
VHGGRARGPHFVQHHGHAAVRNLPRRLGTGEAAANDVDWPQRLNHVAKLGVSRPIDNAASEVAVGSKSPLCYRPAQ